MENQEKQKEKENYRLFDLEILQTTRIYEKENLTNWIL